MTVAYNFTASLGYRRAWLLGDVNGGIVTAIVAIPHGLPLGVIAFAPLGPAYAGIGAAAGLASSVIAGIVVALFGSSRILVGGPRVSSALLMASMLAAGGGPRVTNRSWPRCDADFAAVGAGFRQAWWLGCA